MDNEKKKASSKEVLMIIVVVVLAFGLTVAGIVYLTNFLIGGESPQTAQQDTTTVVPQAPDNVVVFSADDNETGAIPVDPTPSLPPVATTDPVPPAPTTPVIPAPAPATPAPTAPVPATPAPSSPQVASLPQSVPSVATTSGNYQLQLFAFRDQQKANTEAQKYVKEYPDIYIMKADLGTEGIWYRVRCCSNNSQDALKAVKDEIERKHKITPYIVRVQ